MKKIEEKEQERKNQTKPVQKKKSKKGWQASGSFQKPVIELSRIPFKWAARCSIDGGRGGGAPLCTE